MANRRVSGSSDRWPGRRPGPAERAELLAIWDALDHERRKAMILWARTVAKDAGLPGSEGSVFEATLPVTKSECR